MRRWLCAAGTLAMLLSSAASARAVLGVSVQTPGPTPYAWSPSLRIHPAADGLTPLSVRLQLLPQGLGNLLQRGLAVRVSANEAADGTFALTVPRREARRAGLRARAGSVVIARGTTTRIRTGSVRLRLRLAPPLARRLARLSRLTLTLRLAAVGASGQRLTVAVTGSY